MSKGYVTGKKSPNAMRKTREENRTNDQSIKNLPTNEKDLGRKPKDHIDIVDEKTFQLGLKTRKEKSRLMERDRD